MISKIGKSEGYLLVIEDDNSLRELIIKTLSRTGVNAVGFANGAESLEQIYAAPPIAILIDQSLPDMTGKEIIEALSARGLEIPFIVMTGQGDERLAVEMMKLGAADYLTKDIDFLDMLLVAAARLLDSLRKEHALAEAQEAIQRCDAQYKELTDSITDVFFSLDTNLTYTFWNKASEMLLGIKAEEAIGKKLTDIFPDSPEIQRVLAFYQEALKSRKPCSFESEFNGAVFQMSVYPTASGISVIAKDITERKQAEKQIREHAAIVAQTLEGIAVSDLDGNITFTNAAWNRMHGYGSNDSLRGRHLSIFHTQEQLETEVIPFNAVLKERGGNTGEFGHKRKDGTPFPAWMATIILKDDNGNPYGMAAVAQDITERKRAEEALRESEESSRKKIQAILEPQGDIGVLSFGDIIEHETLQALMEDFYRISKVPSAMVDLSGKSLIQVGFQDICEKFHRIHPDTMKNCHEAAAITGNKLEMGEFRVHRCKNNLWDIVTPIEIAGKLMGKIFIGQFFYEDETPDYELFRRQARQYGFDEAEYLAALDRAPRLSRELVEATIRFYSRLAGMISSLSYSTITLSRTLTQRKQAEEAREEALSHALTREKEMRGLLSAAHKVIEEDNFEITARHIFDACCELTGAQSGYVALLSPSGEENELLFLEAGGLPCSVDPELPMPVRGLRAEAYKTGKVVYDNDFMNSPWIQYMPEGHCALGNVLFAPLVVEGKTLGIMGIANKPGGFTEDDARLSGAFGEMAAMAMKNAKSEEALQESYRQYASLFNKMLSAFALHEMIYDSEGSPADYRFLDVNPAFEKLTGLKRKDILEKTVLEVLPDTEAFWIQHYGEVVKTGKPFAFESYSHALDKHFFVTAFTPEENQFAVLFLDITDRKQAETEIETQKLRLQNIIQGTDAGTWEWNVQTGETVFNDKWAEMIGYTLAELAPVSIKTWQKLSHPGDLKKCETLLKKHFSGESEIYETELRMKHKDGRWVWVLDRGKVMQRTSNGDPLWMFGTHQDITERRQARDVIIREKEKAQRYLDIAGVMFVAMDENGIITLANKKAAEILECPEKEIEGENWFDTFIPEKESEKVRKIFGEMLSGRVIPHEYVENHVRAKSGRLKLIAWHNTALETRNGQIIGTISSGEDITARKEAERKLEEKIHELGRFNKLMTGRELKMIELKEEINHLMEKLGLPPKYRGAK